MPRGPRKGMGFDADFMPFSRFIFDAIEDKRWRRLAIVGPTQAGKSLICTNIPLLYFLFEQREDVIFGVPQMSLANGIWSEKCEPIIKDTRYAQYMPTHGKGSRGGNFDAVMFTNGSSLRFMGSGGSDAQRSSHTAKYIIITETDKMDDVGLTSEESDPVSQIIMRADSFEDSKIIMECTVTHEYGRIWQEAMVSGSAGTIYVPCQKCGVYQPLVIEQLRFDATDEITAEETAQYQCQHCEQMMDDSDRLTMLETPLLVHRGQEVLDGKVVGELPRTRTFGLHYNVFYSPMQSINKTAVQKYLADKSPVMETRKAFQQSKLALPWKEEENLEQVLSVTYLSKRAEASGCKLGQVPYWTDYLVFCVDVQKGWMYYHVDAWGGSQQSQVVEYGVVDILEQSDRGIIKALDECENMAVKGWQMSEGKVLQPRLCFVDIGYRYDVIGPWLMTHKRWFGVKGYGQGQKELGGKKKLFEIPGIVQIRQLDDGNKIWFIWVDETKSIVQDRYFVELGQSGYTYVPEDISHSYKMHLTAEVKDFKENSDEFKWKKIRRRNDYLDCRSYSVAGAMYMAVREDFTQEKQHEAIKKREANNKAGIERVGKVGGFFEKRGRFYE